VEASKSSLPLTVAVPTCNGAPHLAEALRSILAQAEVAFELIVSDDRSDDDSVEVVRKTVGDRARVEINSERLGLAGNWNRCASLARTPLLAIFHQDDRMSPGHLAAHVRAFGADDSIGLVASASDVIDEHDEPIPEAVVERGGLGAADRLFDPGRLAVAMAAGNPLRCSAVTMRLAAFAQTGGFDPAYRYVVDWDFWLRVSRTWTVAWLAAPTVSVRWHPGSEAQRFRSTTTDLDETARLLEQLFSLDLKAEPANAQLRQSAGDRLARAYLNRAHDALRAGRIELARTALRSGFHRWPGLMKSILRDPRLCIQMAALAATPRLAGWLFARGEPAGKLPSTP
jgi:GT2 family glycosyltransferase